mmetsp:Transcript_5664/g.12345  ORF Transcript_5664/g.12345 Transcript_5664/m.12345 type:complete len:289 (+) Transcript_5664:1354-2220(+)
MVEWGRRATCAAVGVCKREERGAREFMGMAGTSSCLGVGGWGTRGARVTPESMFKSRQTSTSVLSTQTRTSLPPPASGPTSTSMEPLCMSKRHFFLLASTTERGHVTEPQPTMEACFMTCVRDTSELSWRELPGSRMHSERRVLLLSPATLLSAEAAEEEAVAVVVVASSGPSSRTPRINHSPPKPLFLTCSFSAADRSHLAMDLPSPLPATRYIKRISTLGLTRRQLQREGSSRTDSSSEEGGRRRKVDVERRSEECVGWLGRVRREVVWGEEVAARVDRRASVRSW